MKIPALLFALILASAGGFEIEGVPFVKQETGFCGPASLASVMSFYGIVIDQETIGRSVYTEGLKGSLITDLENYSKAKGFRTRLARGNIEDIRGFIAERHPVIVLVDLGIWIISKPHYLVVTGIGGDRVIAHTGYEASRRFSQKDFMSRWEKQGSVYLLIQP